jgi:cobalt-zinc-cadmium efflux system outer membrane protein
VLGLALLAAAAGGRALAQGPQIDIPEPPGLPGGSGRLGESPGALDGSAFDNPADLGRPIGGRPGPSVSRAPVGMALPPTRRAVQETRLPRPAELPALSVPAYGELDEPTGEEVEPPDGLTLDDAIALLIERNLNLIALRFEVPMADADVLTAGLRANPILYADAQLVPYGRFSNSRPGGQTQYDVNITYPLDVSRKRRARQEVACRARRATEAQLQDVVRLQIDNLYTEFVDVIAAEETLRYSRTYAEGAARLHDITRRKAEAGAVAPDRADALRAQLERAQLQVREAGEALTTATRDLALLLDIPRDRADALKLRGTLHDLRDLPEAPESLVRRALADRPDLVAQRLGVGRAQSEIKLARANRYSDVYLLYQPYTLQDNRPWGLKSPTSWAVGVTATLPIYNRNQGNVRRAELNYHQTVAELTALERQVVHEVEAAVREFQMSRTSVVELEREVLPAQRRVRDTARRQLENGALSPSDYFEAQREFNEVVRLYRDALIRHRRSMLDLNTAVGARVLP